MVDARVSFRTTYRRARAVVDAIDARITRRRARYTYFRPERARVRVEAAWSGGDLCV
jgi:hypothetical protein